MGEEDEGRREEEAGQLICSCFFYMVLTTIDGWFLASFSCMGDVGFVINTFTL